MGFVESTEELNEEANAQAQADFRRRSQKTLFALLMYVYG